MPTSDYDSPRAVRKWRTPRKRILVVTEGEKTEVDYFNKLKAHLDLQRSQLEVQIEHSTEGSTPSRVVRSAKKLRDDAEAKQHHADADGALDARYRFDEVWVVFDTESFSQSYADIKPAAESAESQGIRVAISRPSFESWFLLHLQEGLPAMEWCSDVCKHIRAATSRSLKRDYHKKQDIEWFLDHILPKTKEAIDRSRMVAITAFTDHEHVPNQSGTKVHLLVKALWDASPLSGRSAPLS